MWIVRLDLGSIGGGNVFWKRKEREPTTSPWLEKIQEKTKKVKKIIILRHQKKLQI